MGSATVAKYRLTCGCGATTEVAPPLRRRTPNGWKISGHRGWHCPQCLRLKCVDCQKISEHVPTDEEIRARESEGWKFLQRKGKYGWRCQGCASQKQQRGFAAMLPETQKEIASKGGKKAHATGKAHQWSVEEARVAGRKGGAISRRGRSSAPVMA